jgi:uncharacterized protein YbjT (DUF2867 family)
MEAIVIGATGLTGQALTKYLLQDNAFTKVRLLVRKKTNLIHPKLEEIIFDFEHPERQVSALKGDVLFNALGTTIKKAGSQSAQQIIDRDYPIALAQLAKAQGVTKMLNVSSVGADEHSSNFYLRTKGEMETGVQKIFGNQAIFFQPSFLIGKRQEFRLGEKIGILAMKVADILLVGPLSKYHSIEAEAVAKAMIEYSKNEKTTAQTFDYQGIMKLIKN